MTRIIAGEARGRRLKVPGALTRPTSDRVRESLFASLESLVDLNGTHVLDLFAGSGALGLEARSRGAAEVILVDRAPAVTRVIAENIARFGEIDSEKVIAAAKATGLHETILRFPKGYDTPIGLAGGILSGGQRQRIGLARAVYGDPALIVLDEPNANLDDVGEAALLKSVTQLKAKGATIIVIAHRTTLMGVADNLLLLHDGRVTAFGPRDQVLNALARPALPTRATTP